MFIKRYIEDSVIKDLDKKMVFIGGPRQVGKTTCAKMISKRTGNGSGVHYLWRLPGTIYPCIRQRVPPVDQGIQDQDYTR